MLLLTTTGDYATTLRGVFMAHTCKTFQFDITHMSLRSAYSKQSTLNIKLICECVSRMFHTFLMAF